MVLTFDDGPDPVWTPRLLDLHAIGLHCDEHVRHSKQSEPWVIADTERALERLTQDAIVLAHATGLALQALP